MLVPIQEGRFGGVYADEEDYLLFFGEQSDSVLRNGLGWRGGFKDSVS